MVRPLEDIMVVDLSQFLSAPSATLKLADLGARVIKIERPGTGDICRDHYISNVRLNGESSIFRAINRNKESFEADLKNEVDRKMVMKLVEKADVVVHNYRPGVIERLGFEYAAVRKVNPGIVYSEVSGYGQEGPWRNKAGQDLLVQCLSGITWLSGNADKGPVPLGLALADIITGGHLAIGIMSALVRKGRTGEGAKVSVNMLESILDLQFETVTTFFHDGGQPTARTASNNAHAYLGAPYGVYETNDGFMALAMGSIPVLGELLNLKSLQDYPSPSDWFTYRDEIKSMLAGHLISGPTEKWLSILEPADIWCAEVLNWDRLFAHDAFRAVEMLQTVTMGDGYSYETTRCPIRIDGALLKSPLGSPALGEHTEKIRNSLNLDH